VEQHHVQTQLLSFWFIAISWQLFQLLHMTALKTSIDNGYSSAVAMVVFVNARRT